MSIWTYVTGIVHLNDTTHEDSLLAAYERVSHMLRGSEGGPTINFTKTSRKNFSSSSASDYYVEPFQRINNMTIQGYLRDFDTDKADAALIGIKDFLALLHKHNLVRHASFVIETANVDHYYTVAFVGNRVRHQKVKRQ